MSENKVITEVYDAVSDTKVLIALGTIERIAIKRINPDGSPNVTNITKGPKKGSTFSQTHRASIQLSHEGDKQWVSFGSHEVKNLKYENQYQVKEGDTWVDLKEGMVVRIPSVHKREYQKDGKTMVAYEGKKANLQIKDKSGARESTQNKSTAPQSNQGASNSQTGKSGKVYGEIVSTTDSGTIVRTETGEVTVKLGKEQLDQLVDGGRLAGVFSEDGTLVSGFKAYGPVSAGKPGSQGQQGGRGSNKRDNHGMEVGHCLNGALNIYRSGLNAPVAEIAKVVHEVTKALKTEVSQFPAYKKYSEYDLGSMVGHAVLNATRDIQFEPDAMPEVITDKLRTYTLDFINTVVPVVDAYVRGVSLENQANNTPEPQLAPAAEDIPSSPAPSGNGHINMTPPPMDFDEDIPFAPICLMYPNHAIYAL